LANSKTQAWPFVIFAKLFYEGMVPYALQTLANPYYFIFTKKRTCCNSQLTFK